MRSRERSENRLDLWTTHAVASGGWLHRGGVLLVRTGRDLLADNAPQWAAAIAYYSLLSAFPFLLAAIAFAAYFVDPTHAAEQVIGFLGEFVPRGQGFIRDRIMEAYTARSTAGFLSLVLLLWTGSRVFGVLIRALNIIYNVKTMYGFWKRLGIELIMTVSLGLLFVLALSSGYLLRLLWSAVPFLPDQRGAIFIALKWTLTPLLLFAAFFLIYRFVPHGRQETHSALVGAATATLLFLLARPLFAFYVQQFAGYNLIYGSVAVVIALMVWAWVTAFITLLGGELASQMQLMGAESWLNADVNQQGQERPAARKS